MIAMSREGMLVSPRHAVMAGALTRHCERSEAIQEDVERCRFWIASLRSQ